MRTRFFLTALAVTLVTVAFTTTAARAADTGPTDHHGRHARRAVAGLVAETIGIERHELRTALRDRQTIAEVAQANGVDAQAVVDALTAACDERLAEAIANGRIDETQAAALRARATERIETFVYETGSRRETAGTT